MNAEAERGGFQFLNEATTARKSQKESRDIRRSGSVPNSCTSNNSFTYYTLSSWQPDVSIKYTIASRPGVSFGSILRSPAHCGARALRHQVCQGAEYEATWHCIGARTAA